MIEKKKRPDISRHVGTRKKKKKSADRAIGPESCEPLKQPKLAGLAVHTASTRNVCSTPLITSPFRSTRPTLSLSLFLSAILERILEYLYIYAPAPWNPAPPRDFEISIRHAFIADEFNFPNYRISPDRIVGSREEYYIIYLSVRSFDSMIFLIKKGDN